MKRRLINWLPRPACSCAVVGVVVLLYFVASYALFCGFTTYRVFTVSCGYLQVGLLSPDGKDMPLRLQDNTEDLGTTTVLRLEADVNEFVFTNVDTEPVASLLRDFSAPVKMTVEGQTDDQLVFLFANDSDPFNR